jgi:hypothetical protein
MTSGFTLTSDLWFLLLCFALFQWFCLCSMLYAVVADAPTSDLRSLWLCGSNSYSHLISAAICLPREIAWALFHWGRLSSGFC